MPAHRGDNADFTFGSGQGAPSCRSWIFQEGIDPGWLDAGYLADNFSNGDISPVMITAVLMLSRHQLDKPNMIGLVECPGCKIRYLVIVDTVHHHGV
jgi:hypothetical protein